MIVMEAQAIPLFSRRKRRIIYPIINQDNILNEGINAPPSLGNRLISQIQLTAWDPPANEFILIPSLGRTDLWKPTFFSGDIKKIIAKRNPHSFTSTAAEDMISKARKAKFGPGNKALSLARNASPNRNRSFSNSYLQREIA
jgi:hypothetical protein